MRSVYKCKIVSKTKQGQAFDYRLECAGIASLAVAGQFVNLRAEGFTLRRPISICEIDKPGGAFRIIFEVRGDGTKKLAEKNVGEYFDILGPLGRGFDLISKDKKALFVGGGIGVPPLLGAAGHFGKNAAAILGFRSKNNVLLDGEFEALVSKTVVCTEDGSAGVKGFVTGPLEEMLATKGFDIVYTCGPTPMLKAVADTAARYGVRCQVSMEERMACGLGACLVCACKTAAKDGGHSYSHVCKDGPVFNAEKVVWE